VKTETPETRQHDTFSFEIEAEHGPARLARYQTPHGTISTPAFVAVGTRATVKGVTAEQTAEAGTQVLFNNTYHLYLRPGAEIVRDQGGLHRFMNWNRPLMTDSGGFQVFSLGAGIEHGVGKISSIFPGEEPAAGERRGKPGESFVRVTEDGVHFRSHLDGSSHFFTPELSIRVQRELGADIILAFDECTSPLHDESYTRASMDRTHRWAQRSLDYFQANGPLHGYPQALFGIVQGGAFRSLRTESARVIGAMPFDGIAIGGNLGRSHQDMHDVIDWTVAELPRDKPRHLLGIGDVPGVIEGVARGCDTFDCVSPTRNARNGAALRRFDDDGSRLERFRVNLRSARFANDPLPIEPGCDCHACRNYSRAYLRHLLKSGEQLGQQLTTIHNLHFMARLMSDIRESLREGSFSELKRDWLG
jgi:tRNA-guanine transglycosylase